MDLVAGYQPARWLAMKANGGLLVAETGAGESERFPDTGDRFTAEEAPGIGDRIEFLRLGAGVYGVWAGDPNRPALELAVEGARYTDQDGGRYSFNRLSVDARGFIPLGSRQRTFAARLFASRDLADAGA